MKANQTIKQALKKAMTTRDLTTTQCVPFVIQADKPKFMVDWNTSTALLGGQEASIVLPYSALFSRCFNFEVFVDLAQKNENCGLE